MSYIHYADLCTAGTSPRMLSAIFAAVPREPLAAKAVLTALVEAGQVGVLAWLAAHALSLSVADREAFIAATGDVSNYGYAAAHAPGVPLADRERLIRRSDNPSYWFCQAAAFGPGLFNAERERFIDLAFHRCR